MSNYKNFYFIGKKSNLFWVISLFLVVELLLKFVVVSLCVVYFVRLF